jgi:hypothetical protein
MTNYFRYRESITVLARSHLFPDCTSADFHLYYFRLAKHVMLCQTTRKDVK